VTPGSLLIDRFLPRYDLSVVHASVLPARPEGAARTGRVRAADVSVPGGMRRRPE
jgi:hypothetical protein